MRPVHGYSDGAPAPGAVLGASCPKKNQQAWLIASCSWRDSLPPPRVAEWGLEGAGPGQCCPTPATFYRHARRLCREPGNAALPAARATRFRPCRPLLKRLPTPFPQPAFCVCVRQKKFYVFLHFR